MIFKAKDLVKKKCQRGSREFEIFNNYFKIICWGEKMLSNYIRWWNCSLYKVIPREPDLFSKSLRKLFEFTAPQPWGETKMLYSLNKALQEGGKQKLIRAIYNDFEA